ncbi:hypothetical protein O3P69_008079 [Scylla paramamosain]|uniref:Uncharacterized protein n=1 Tax=Scylla paramamosain TaxID=85552 RepID=A0AAW0T0R5_SCYPA
MKRKQSLFQDTRLAAVLEQSEQHAMFLQANSTFPGEVTKPAWTVAGQTTSASLVALGHSRLTEPARPRCSRRPIAPAQGGDDVMDGRRLFVELLVHIKDPANSFPELPIPC